MTGGDVRLSFWDHLDVLRGSIIRILAIWCVISIVAFLFKDLLFDFVLAPKSQGFITYRVIEDICGRFGMEAPGSFDVSLINTGLAQQFLIHMKTAMCAGVILAAPYALFELFRFVAPALYGNERRFALRIVSSGYVMFLLGVALSYLMIFPLTFRFLGTYQVSESISNMITLDSYMSTLIMMCLCMGAVCELPVVAWLGARAGFVESSMMTRFRRHAIVVILIVAAIITPTSDIVTLLLVSVPIWLLYEISVLIVRCVERSVRQTTESVSVETA